MTKDILECFVFLSRSILRVKTFSVLKLEMLNQIIDLEGWM